MTLEGELVVTLARDGQRVQRVNVRSTRPLVASRILVGKTAVDAAATVPLLYSLCGGAHGAAAACALAAAGAAGFDEHSAARAAGIIVESLQEGFWHLLIGWPNAIGSEPQFTPVTAARYLIATSIRSSDGTERLGDNEAMYKLALGLTRIAARSLFAMAPAEFLALSDVAALEAWAERTSTVPARLLRHVLAEPSIQRRSDVRLMPAARRDLLLHVVAPALRDDPGFARAPTWDGAPVETGALARMREHPLVAACDRRFGHATVTRIVARIAEVALSLEELASGHEAIAAKPRAQSVALGAGDGLGSVETARGLLLHRARVHDECVVDYQIVAPTEWNFHPDGALVQSMTGAAADDEGALLRSARLNIHTLDPCVACRVEVARA